MTGDVDREFQRDLIDRVGRIESKIDAVNRYQGSMERRLLPLEKFQGRIVAIAATIGALVTAFLSPVLRWLLST